MVYIKILCIIQRICFIPSLWITYKIHITPLINCSQIINAFKRVATIECIFPYRGYTWGNCYTCKVAFRECSLSYTRYRFPFVCLWNNYVNVTARANSSYHISITLCVQCKFKPIACGNGKITSCSFTNVTTVKFMT